jgi:endonuclease YncB( thermonuclease family)
VTQKSNLSNSDYKSLLSEISTIYQHSLQEGDSDWNKSVLIGHWNIGKRLSDIEKSLSSNYGNEIIKKLSIDLKNSIGKGFSPRNLFNFKKFYNLYPKAKINPILSWSHYSVLITIDDPRKRKSYETKAISKNLSFRDLRSLLLSHQASQPDVRNADLPSTLPRPNLELGHYKTIIPFPNQSTLALLDLGFYVSITLPTSLPHQASQPDDLLPKVTTVPPTYTYKAFLKKVIDGDTLEVIIDLGFQTFITQRLRLKSIDTPDRDTKEGLASKQFVESILSNVKFLIIKTYSHDKYDRYLVDVFFLDGDVSEENVIQKGRFLNQEILDAGMGWVW